MPDNSQVLVRELIAERHADHDRMPESKHFEIFVAETVLKDFDLSTDEVLAGVTGGSQDGGIDAMYVFLGKNLVSEDTFSDTEPVTLHRPNLTLKIIQAKYANGFESSAVEKLIPTLQDLLNLSVDLSTIAGRYRPDLLSIAQTFRNTYRLLRRKMPTIAVHLYYGTCSIDPPSDLVEHRIAQVRATVDRLFPGAGFQFFPLGADQLWVTANRIPERTRSLKCSDTMLATKAFLCLTTLHDYYRFVADGDGEPLKWLFESNVRDYQGDVTVNQQIADALDTPRDEFWWLNNGVTVIAKEGGTDSDRIITLTDPQVVNGLQTTYAVCNYMRNRGASHTDTRTLLVRVLLTDDPEARDRIIRATNSQTKMPLASLRATHALHRMIEAYFERRGLFYDRRKNSQRNMGKPLDRIISIKSLAQWVMAVVLAKPNYSRARPSNLISNDSDYADVFNDNYPLDLYLKCILVGRRVQEFLASLPDELGRNNVQYHLAMYAVRKALRNSGPTRQQIAELDHSILSDQYLKECFDQVTDVYQRYVNEGSVLSYDQASKSRELVQVLLSIVIDNDSSIMEVAAARDPQSIG